MNREMILLIEDDADEIHLMKRALAKAGLVNPLHVITHGSEVSSVSPPCPESRRTRSRRVRAARLAVATPEPT